MNLRRFFQVFILLLAIQPQLMWAQPNLPRRNLPRPDARSAQKRHRLIDFSLESFELATNSVKATLMSFGEAPKQIAVIVKPISGKGPFKGAEAAFDEAQGDLHGNPVRARMRAIRATWQEASWIPFTTNLTIDLGPGNGWRLIQIGAKWDGEMEHAAGTWVRVEHPPNLTVLSQSKSFDESQETAGATEFVAVQGSLNTNAVTLNPNQPACGTFRLHLNETAGRNLVLLASTNLTDWAPILTNLNCKESFEYTDTNVGAYPCRFFRVVTVP